MKKLIAIFLLTVYTVTAFGVAINYHYCNNHLTQVTFLTFGGKSGCACHQNAASKGCCKDVTVYKKAGNHKTSQESYTINTISFTPCLPPVNELHNRAIPGINYISDIFSDNVRRCCLQPIYILIRVFRI